MAPRKKSGNGPEKRRPKKGPDKRGRLLAAASGVFARRGFRGATIDEIAAAAGVAKGTVYLYFASKEDLFFALFEHMTQRALAATLDPAQMNARSAAERIETIFFSLAADLDGQEAMIPLMLEFWSASGVEETRTRFGGAFAAMFADFRRTILGILKEGSAQGEFRQDAACDEVASSLMAMIDGLILQQWTDPRVRLTDSLRKALPVFLSGLES